MVAAEESWKKNDCRAVATRDAKAKINRGREKKKQFSTEKSFLPDYECGLFLIQKVAFLRDVYSARNLSDIEKPLRSAYF